MQTYQKILLFLALIICLSYACDRQEQDLIIEETEAEYELLVSYGTQADAYRRRHLVDYFQMVALGTEYGNGIPLVKKWVEPMQIYVSGTPDTTLLTELNSIIEELNALFTDGFYIEQVTDSLAANYHIFFGDAALYKRQYPEVVPYLKENRGLFTIHTNANFNITSGHMFVDITDVIPLRYQKHILREELTQSLGLANDIKYYPNSIFYEKWTDVQEYSDLDMETIRLLYHPRMITKIGSSTVSSILKTILGL